MRISPERLRGVQLSEDFNEESLSAVLKGRRIGHPLVFLEETDSTNTIAFQLAVKGAPEGTVVVADRQTKGRGRMHRVWQSPPGCNIYTSIVLRPGIAPAVAPQITLLAGVAVADTLASWFAEGVTLKWPNDVLLKGRKISGILTEMKTCSAGIDFVIVGAGINVNMSAVQMDGLSHGLATSMMMEAAAEVSRTDVIAGLCERLAGLYAEFLDHGFDPARKKWLRYCDMIGKPVQIIFKDDIQSGEVMGLAEDGALIIMNGDGKPQRILAGDASIKKER